MEEHCAGTWTARDTNSNSFDANFKALVAAVTVAQPVSLPILFWCPNGVFAFAADVSGVPR